MIHFEMDYYWTNIGFNNESYRINKAKKPLTSLKHHGSPNIMLYIML